MISSTTLVSLLSFLTLLGDVVVVIFLLLTLIEVLFRRSPLALTRAVAHWGIPLMCVIAVMASLGSLTFSEILGWTPCKDCWFQRIFMYSQALILLLALLRRDRNIAPYVLLLSLVGMAFAIDQYSGQVRTILLPALTGTCGDPSANCNATQIFKFGYITIPTMALTAFAMNALIAWAMIRKRA